MKIVTIQFYLLNSARNPPSRYFKCENSYSIKYFWIMINMPSLGLDKLLTVRNVAVITLIVGLIIGYQASEMIASPKITNLEEQLQAKNNEISSLQSQLNVIQSNLTEVYELYIELRDNSVNKTIYNNLIQSYNEQSKEFEEAEARIKQLETLSGQLFTENQLLTDKYDRLLENYNEIRVLSYTSYVVNGLQINLTVSKSEYISNVPVKGTLSIQYLDGRPFNGYFSLTVWSDYYSSGKSTDLLLILGETDYTVDIPFSQGPGNYYLKLSAIKNLSKVDMASYSQLNAYRIKLFMG